MAVVKLNEENFKTETEKGIVLVDFYADWCGPCQMLSPVLEELASEFKGAKIAKVNVDESRPLAGQFGISSIPNITVLKDGEVVAQEIGFKPKEALMSLLESVKN